MIAARFLPYAVSLLLDLAYAIIAVCALSRDTWASPLRTLACLLLCILLMVSTWWQSAHAWARRDQPDSHVPGSPHRQH